ncbi:MAG: hypothetical protein CXR31_05935 [Geobacter sp.]|nr:MAG: hypothetical protein CXR31_05935 [Geobacter sp.]
MTVLGQKVTFDSTTVFADFPTKGTSSVVPGQMVQVSGFADPSGTIRATRIERHTPDWTPTTTVELKGTISSTIAASTFSIGNLTVDATGITLPTGTNVGSFVKVEGRLAAFNSTTLKATSVSLRKDGIEMNETDREHTDVEGYVRNLAGNRFMIGDTLVNAGTLSLAGIANGVKVEVEGYFLNGILIATSIKIEGASTTPTTVPAAPVASAVGGLNQVTISWDGVSGATSYNIYWSTTAGVTTATGAKIAGVTSPYVHTGRTAGTTYYYVVTAVNSVGESVPSAQVSATPTSVPTVPAAPIGVSAVGGANQVTISWAAVAGLTYNIYWAPTAGVTPATGTKITSATSPYVQSGLTAGTTNYYVVTAVNVAGESAPSAQVSATTAAPAPQPPSAPTGITATVVSPNQVNVSWSAVTGAVSYNIYWSTTTGVTPSTGTLIANATSPYSHTGLTASTTYYYVVTAVNAAGESAPSAQASATTAATPQPPAAPTGVTAVGGTNQVTVSWAAVAGATSYNLYWSTTTGVTPATGTLIANVTSPFVHMGLTPSTTYYYVVTAVNAVGSSAPSAQVSATTSAAPLVCGTCHAIPPATGQHDFHVNSLGYSCAICHGTGYSSTTVNTTLHLNGVVDVVSSIGWNATTSTCATPGCHGSRTW